MPKSRINPEKYKDLVSTNKDLVADYRPLNFDSLLARKALRVTHQGIGDGEYNPDPKAGFSIVSAYNDAIGDGGGTNKWKDNPDMYPVVRRMFQNEPSNMGAHKYLQIVESAKDLGLSDDEIYMPTKATEYSKGGAVKKTKKQMKKLFEDGGLLQEGGTVDKDSGNKVPVGSLKKEVRDDIPAQLSEGEFVFPADVVRFIGLQKLMDLRQAAKEGLAKMEAMGQMGNADEATEDDTGEFETELDDILDEIESESEEEGTEEDSPSKKAKGGQVRMAAGGLASPNPFTTPFSTERYSKAGQKDIFIPTFSGQPQGAIPEGFQKSTKVQSFGGVFREAGEAKPTVTATTGQKTTADLTKTSTTATTDLTKTTQPIPDAYKDLDVDTDKNKYLLNIATKDAEKYTADNKAKGRAWGQGQIYDNPFANLTEFGTKKDNEVDAEGNLTGNTIDVNKTVYDYIAGAFPSAPDGKTIFDHKSTFLKVYKRDASGNPKEVSNPESLTLQEINSGDVLFQVGGKTGGANRERMAQVYQVVEDKLIPVGKASFYKGEHPDAELAMPIAMGAAFALAPFTGGASVAIGEAILGAGAVGAATLGSAIMGATISGVTAAATGGNIGKAMVSGAVSGGIGANAMDITNAVLGPDVVNSISQATNLSTKQIASVFSNSIASGVNTTIQGGDFSDVIKTFGQSLVTSGVSEIAATNAMKTLSGSVDPKNLQRIGTATKMLSNVALNAAMKGLDIDKAIQYYAPTIMTRALTTPGGG